MSSIIMNIPCICGEPELDPHTHIMADNHVQIQFPASEDFLSIPQSLHAGTTYTYIQTFRQNPIHIKQYNHKSLISFKIFSKNFLHVEHFKLKSYICDTYINTIYI